MEKNGFWDYVERWRKTFDGQSGTISWNKNWLENSWCGKCRFCCGPQDSDYPFPMALLPGQTGPATPNDFHLLDASTACLAKEGCKSDGPCGCRLPLEKKPIACGLFPIVLVNGCLYLYQNCPAVVFTPLAGFMEIAQKAADMLIGLPFDDLRHLSIWLCCDALAKSYIDLHIRIFSWHGKKLVFS